MVASVPIPHVVTPQVFLAPQMEPRMADNDSLPEGYFARVPLRRPVVRGESKVTSILLREPNGTALMNVELFDLMRMNTTEIIKVLPRISEPPLLADECKAMGGPDLFEVGQEIAAFLLL